MRLSHQIPLITGLVLILTIVVNLFAFQSIADSKVIIYQKEVESTVTAPDPEKLKAFTELSTLDDKTRNEYNEVLNELSLISTALQNISSNPELYVGGSGSATSTSLSIGGSSGVSQKVLLPFFAIFDIRSITLDTAEGRLVRAIIQELIVVNLFWLVFVYIIYMLWIRSVFSPVERVTENIRKITDNGEYTSLIYNKSDEFFPLISSINNLHKSLSIQEKIRSNFLTDLSHEIRTPITAVRCYLEAIEDGVMELDAKTLSLFQNELSRLTTTTEDIMQFERTTNPTEKKVRVERFSIRKSILPLIQEYIPQTQPLHQSIIIDMSGDTMIRMDEAMFSQIIHNIFSNFVKYAGKGSTLTCGYQKTETDIILRFIDNGIGVPMKDMPFIKEKFYRVDTSRTRTSKSMGVGLSVVNHIMRIHGGKFILEHNTPHGLIISLIFPR